MKLFFSFFLIAVFSSEQALCKQDAVATKKLRQRPGNTNEKLPMMAANDLGGTKVEHVRRRKLQSTSSLTSIDTSPDSLDSSDDRKLQSTSSLTSIDASPDSLDSSDDRKLQSTSSLTSIDASPDSLDSSDDRKLQSTSSLTSIDASLDSLYSPDNSSPSSDED
jgi:hypothetical protein